MRVITDERGSEMNGKVQRSVRGASQRDTITKVVTFVWKEIQRHAKSAAAACSAVVIVLNAMEKATNAMKRNKALASPTIR